MVAVQAVQWRTAFSRYALIDGRDVRAPGITIVVVLNETGALGRLIIAENLVDKLR